MAGFKSFIDQAKQVRGLIDVEIDGWGMMQDGKPPAFRCKQFGNLDWHRPELGEYQGVPRLIGEGKKIADMSQKEQQQFLDFCLFLAIRAVRFVREVDDDGKEFWRPCRLRRDEDLDEPVIHDNGLAELPVSFIDTNWNPYRIGLAVLNDSNYGGQLSDFADDGFREAPPDKDRSLRKKGGNTATRVPAEHAGRTR